MSSITSTEIRQEFLKSKIGIAGIGILASLILISISAAIFIPVDTFKEWNNPGSWISFPKTSMPSWVNLFMFEKIPEHKIIDPFISSQKTDEISLISQQFNVNYEYDDFPNASGHSN
jgi:peptide/nickel transport system permease protein